MRNSIVHEYDNHNIEVKVFNKGYELWIDGKQVDKNYSLFSLPFVGGSKLKGNINNKSVVAFIRNMGINYRLELEINGQNVLNKFFT